MHRFGCNRWVRKDAKKQRVPTLMPDILLAFQYSGHLLCGFGRERGVTEALAEAVAEEVILTDSEILRLVWSLRR